jgi:hypothetical protein
MGKIQSEGKSIEMRKMGWTCHCDRCDECLGEDGWRWSQTFVYL